MGAFEFVDGAEVQGFGGPRTVGEAFRACVDNARYEHGHGGYTGTIAEKSSFGLVEFRVNGKLATYAQARDEADRLIRSAEAPYDDKWGPAGAIPYRKKGGRKVAGWVFFGRASS